MLKIAKMFYSCHLKKLVRPETFGPYYVPLHKSKVLHGLFSVSDKNVFVNI